jgi:prolyl oligopeptidase
MSVALHPETRLGDETVELHGRSIPDPYRWLEDADTPEIRAWVDAQNAYTESVLSASTSREAIRERMTELFGYAKVGAPKRSGGRWFQWRNSGLQNQSVLFVMSSQSDEGRVLLDPNAIAADGTQAVMGTSVNPDGSLLAYALSDGGSDWMTWHVRDVETGEDLPDLVEWTKFSGAAWAPDGSGFYYSGFDAPEQGLELYERNDERRVYFHTIGTPQSDDPVVYERPGEPELFLAADVTFDGRYVVLSVSHATAPENELHVLDLEAAEPAWQALVPERTSLNHVIGNAGRDFFLLTDFGASRRRIVRVSLDHPGRDAWVELVPEGEHKLTGAAHAGDRLVCHTLVHGTSGLSVYGTDGAHLHDVAAPPFSAILELSGRPDELEFSGRPDDPLIFFSTTSYSDPGSVWSHDVATGETTQVWAASAPFDRDAIVTEQVFVESLDGTKIPALLVRRKDVQPTGDVPTLLTAYGGFNIPLLPVFAIYAATWVDRGGLFVSANLRGGGEYGLDWYHAGRRERKQNCFDDFCSVARWLHSSGWSNPSRIAIKGKSNGGLLVGACVTQHPELFGAVIPEVGVLDMLRFSEFTIGWAWATEYGHAEDETEFGWLIDYSPLHNIRPGTEYPPVMVTTGDHDDRVVPAHSYKFAAALQAAQGGDAPVVIRVETKAGHGAGKPTAKIIAEFTDMLAFLELALGVS